MKISDTVSVVDPNHKRFRQVGVVVGNLPLETYVNVRYTRDDRVFTIRKSSLQMIEEDF